MSCTDLRLARTLSPTMDRGRHHKSGQLQTRGQEVERVVVISLMEGPLEHHRSDTRKLRIAGRC